MTKYKDFQIPFSVFAAHQVPDQSQFRDREREHQNQGEKERVIHQSSRLKLRVHKTSKLNQIE